MVGTSLNLLHQPWLPAIRRSGRCLIRPAEISADHATDPVLALDWSRPDFRAAGLEFLIALLSTLTPPADEEAWADGWHKPPSPGALDAALAPYAHAFELDGPGPRFMQDVEDLAGEASPPSGLLIDAPGENAQRNNTDLMVKRGGVRLLGRAAAAMALFTLQTYAPAGGAGHRVGFRGGGPLTTLVLPEPRTLWHTVWANVGTGTPPAQDQLPEIFPWLAPTRTSGKGENKPLARTDRNAAQMFWAMPKRIRLDFAANTESRPCDLTGQRDEVTVTGWRSRPYGAQYDPAGWTHPLSPHYRQKVTEPWLPVHGQPGGIGYRQWAALAIGDDRGLRSASETVRRFRADRLLETGMVGVRLRLFAAGYDMDNAKPRGFIEAEMPLPTLADGGARQRLDDHAQRLVEAATLVADLLRGALRMALFGPGGKADAASSPLQTARDAFWGATEDSFYGLLHQATLELAENPDAELQPSAETWRRALRAAALAGFDAAAPLDPDAYRVRGGEALGSAQSVVAARRMLGIALAGYGRQGAELLKALALPLPEQPAASRGRRKVKEASA